MKLASILSAALVALCGSIWPGPTAAEAVERQVSIQNFAFSPHGLHIAQGDTVTWTNRDAVQHSSTSDQLVWDSGLLFTNQSYSFQFTGTGSFPYHCSVHLSMRDTIFVFPPTGVEEQGTAPYKFELAQNYPNPFNASTNIDFALNSRGHATLEIYDLLGRKVAALLDSDLGAGSYSYNWNAQDQTSGVFFYRLSFDGRFKSGRMILLK